LHYVHECVVELELENLSALKTSCKLALLASVSFVIKELIKRGVTDRNGEAYLCGLIEVVTISAEHT